MRVLAALAQVSTVAEAVRLVKKRHHESIWHKLNFHLEPSYPDSSSCDRGQLLGEEDCQKFSEMLQQSWQSPQAPFEIIDKSGWIFGCMLDLGSGGWMVKYNNDSSLAKTHNIRRVRVCDGFAKEQLHFYNLGPLGAGGCGYKLRLERSECIVAALQALINGGHGYTKVQVADKHVGRDSHPIGCHVRRDDLKKGDNMWVISYKDAPLVPPAVEADYTKWRPICADIIKAPHHNGTAALELGTGTPTVCDPLRRSFCSDTGCRSCTSRRRQACRWYHDAICCVAPVCEVS